MLWGINKSFKKIKMWFFFGKSAKNSHFNSKMSQKAPRAPLEPPMTMNIISSVARISKPKAREKNFFIISHKKEVGETKQGTWPSYWFLANNAKCHEVPAWHRQGSSSEGHLEPKSPKTWWGVVFRGGIFFSTDLLLY